MGVEIERKFLVSNDAWKRHILRSVEMAQGYLGESSKASIRIRVAGEDAWLSVKSARSGLTRAEYEYPVPPEDGREMLQQLTRQGIVEKTRYWIQDGTHTWELDVFHGENEGLVIAELELNREDEDFEIPSWLGPEVTHDERYYNSSLAQTPYSCWGAWAGEP
jgi:adenylate cyclase